MNDKEKILIQQQKTAEALRILDEILDIIRFKDEPGDTIIDQKLEEIKKAAMFIDSFIVRTNTNLKKCASSKDLPEKESVIEILESQKRVLEKIKEILTSN